TIHGEGAVYVFNVAPVRILGESGKVVGIELIRTAPGPDDKSGRPTPKPVPGSQFIVPCTTVVAALGEVADLSFLPSGTRTHDGHVVVAPETCETNIPRLYAAGEMTGAKGTATAFHAGFACADVVHKRLAELPVAAHRRAEADRRVAQD